MSYTPGQIKSAYGFNQLPQSLNGTGQTIAIVDAYDDPTITSDLHAFDAAFGLPDPPSFQKVTQDVGNSPPSANSHWAIEIALDVEWAHAMAPGANILLVEAHDTSNQSLFSAVDYARNQPGVSVVSMSWGQPEFAGENQYDGYFTTPSGHQGVTFVASSGDLGQMEYPSASPNVVSVGGTTLTINSSGGYGAETAWSGSGGGVSSYEPKPSYQNGVVVQNGNLSVSYFGRMTPDVAYDADPNTGFWIYDSYETSTPLFDEGGTSAGAPQWAALIALADQGRALEGLESLDGPTQTLPLLYQLSSIAFHDVTSDGNGTWSAGPGYDLVTGLGSPIANRVVYGLIGANYQLRPDHTLWQVTGVGQDEIASDILAFSEAGDGSLTVLDTAGDVVQLGAKGQSTHIIAENVFASAVDEQQQPVDFQSATQYGVDNAGNVFVLTADGRLWRILDAGGTGAPVADVVRYGGQSFSIDAADTVFALSQDGHLDRGLDLDQPGLGSWIGVSPNVQQYAVDKAGTLFMLRDGIVYRGLGFDQTGGGSWTPIGYNMQSFTVDAADTVFNFGTDGRVWAGRGLDQPGGGTWNVIGYDMKSFYVDAADTVFNLGFDGRVWRGLDVDQTGTGDNWTVIGYGMSSFAVDQADTVYNIATNGVVWRGTGLDQVGGGSWTVLGTNEQEAQVAADGSVYMLDQSGNLSRVQDPAVGGAESGTVATNVESFTLFDGGQALAYLGTDGDLYQLAGGATTLIHSGVASIAGGQALVYLGTDGNLYQLAGGVTTLIHSGVASMKLGSDGSTVYFLADDWSIWKESGGQAIPLVATGPGSYPAWSVGTPNLGGVWFITGGLGTEETQIVQDGDKLTFINENGNSSTGYYVGNNRVQATTWNLGGTIEYTATGVRIAWDNGSSWDQGLVAGRWTIGAGRPTAVIQDGAGLLFVNENGDWSSGYYSASNQVEATDWGWLTGNLVSDSNGVHIQWANGTTWDQGSTVMANTWYANLTGDGHADRIFRGVGNTFYVSQWTGSGFSTPELWVQEGGPFLDDQVFFADLTGNGRDDLIYRGADNSFWVSLSTGTGFLPPQNWVSEGGPYDTGQVFFADLTGNGMQDMIFRGIDNRFWVSLATGTGFAAPELWATEGGPFVDGQVQFADLTGNGKQDMIFQGVDNTFWVSLSTGTGFLLPQFWASEGGPFVVGEAQFADVTGNGKADLIYRGIDNRFWVSLSTGAGFLAPQLWASEGGPYINGQAQYADLNGDGKADLIFQGVDNRFWVSLSTGTGFAGAQLWATEGGPYVNGQARYVDLTGNGKKDLVFQSGDDSFSTALATGNGLTLPQPGGPAAPGSGDVVSTVAAGDGGVFLLHADGTLDHYSAVAGWTAIDPGMGDVASIAAAGDGGIFVLHANGTLDHFTYGVGWTAIDPGIGDVLSIAAAGDGGIFVLHANRTVDHYTFALGWAAVDPGIGDVVSMVAAGDGGIYLLHANGTLNHYTYGVGWAAVDPGIGDVFSIAAAANGSIAVVKTDGSQWIFSTATGWSRVG